MRISHVFTIVASLLVLSLGGIAYMLWGDSLPLPSSQRAQPIAENAEPEVVTIDALAPSEVVRVWLQAWFARDFSTQFDLLAPQARVGMTRSRFIEMMEGLPELAGIRIANIEEQLIGEDRADVTLTITPDSEEISESFQAVFGFVRTDDGWKVAEIPVLLGEGK
jgi:hypothetical protein